MQKTACRCGFIESTSEPHPCHANGYLCRKPAKQHFYVPGNFALAGAQMKVSASDTWACNECWEKFAKLFKQR